MACGLRYPLMDMHAQGFGIRCPVCLGETRVALSRKRIVEPGRDLSEAFSRQANNRGRNSNPDSPKEVHWELAVLLDNIRSAWNVGSILRSADGFGFAHAFLCGITPTPESEAVQKTALGAHESVTWSYHKDALKLVQGLKKEGWIVLALEEHQRSVALESYGMSSSMYEHTLSGTQAPGLQLLIVGNELTGVDPELLGLCDSIYYIPMHGHKRSFNVAIAFGIAAYALMR